MHTFLALSFSPVVVDILKIGLPGVCFLFVAYNFHLFRRAQQDNQSVVTQILNIIKGAKLSKDNFAALMEVIKKAIQSKDATKAPVRFAWVTFAFVSVVFLFQVISIVFVPLPPDPVPKDLLGVWYYNALTEDGRKIHGGKCELVTEQGRVVFNGKRLYTYTKRADGTAWDRDYGPMEWHSTPVTMVGNHQLLFHYHLTQPNGKIAEGVCFGTISGSGPEQEVFGRILTNLADDKPPGAGLNQFVRDNRWPQNADINNQVPAWK